MKDFHSSWNIWNSCGFTFTSVYSSSGTFMPTRIFPLLFMPCLKFASHLVWKTFRGFAPSLVNFQTNHAAGQVKGSHLESCLRSVFRSRIHGGGSWGQTNMFNTFHPHNTTAKPSTEYFETCKVYMHVYIS